MKVWVGYRMDFSDCYYEGDYPAVLVKAFKSQEAFEKFYKKEEKCKRWDWEVKECEVAK